MGNDSDQMPGIKRHRDGLEKQGEANMSPFMPMFEVFRDELDEHHDRRERIVKASRDITAASKKMRVPSSIKVFPNSCSMADKI